MRRCALLGLLALAATSGASAAPAGEAVGQDKSGDVAARGLTAKERAALDILSVTAAGEEGLGVLVTVTFRGDFRKGIGQGALKKALAALILHPRAGAGTTAGIITMGTEFGKKTIPLTPKLGVNLRTVTVKELRRTRSEQAGAVRNGRQLTFYVAGGGFSGVEAVEVKALVGRSATTRSAAQTPPRASDRDWARTQSASDGDKLKFASKPDSLTCDELRRLAKRLDLLIDIEETRLRETTRWIDAELERFRSTVRFKLKDEISQSARTELNDYIRLLGTFETRIRVVIDDLKGLRKRVQDEIQRRCQRPTTLSANFRWENFGPGEVRGRGRFTATAALRTTAGVTTPLDAVRVVVPSRLITNFLCPAQLPVPTASGDTLTCSGGTLPVGQEFTLNVRTFPGPEPGMGGQLYGRQDGAFAGPYAIAGP